MFIILKSTDTHGEVKDEALFLSPICLFFFFFAFQCLVQKWVPNHPAEGNQVSCQKKILAHTCICTQLPYLNLYLNLNFKTLSGAHWIYTFVFAESQQPTVFCSQTECSSTHEAFFFLKNDVWSRKRTDQVWQACMCVLHILTYKYTHVSICKKF